MSVVPMAPTARHATGKRIGSPLARMTVMGSAAAVPASAGLKGTIPNETNVQVREKSKGIIRGRGKSPWASALAQALGAQSTYGTNKYF